MKNLSFLFLNIFLMLCTSCFLTATAQDSEDNDKEANLRVRTKQQDETITEDSLKERKEKKEKKKNKGKKDLDAIPTYQHDSSEEEPGFLYLDEKTEKN